MLNELQQLKLRVRFHVNLTKPNKNHSKLGTEIFEEQKFNVKIQHSGQINCF